MERGPFSYTDPASVEWDLRKAGFDQIELQTVERTTRVTARDAAQGDRARITFQGGNRAA